MIQNDIYCYVSGFWKSNISKKTSYNVGNKEITRKICNLNLRNKMQQYSSGTTGEKSSQRKRARSQLKVPIDETIRRSLGNASLVENLCIFRVP